MKKVLLKDVPRKCPKCDVFVFTEAPRPRLSRKTKLIALLGFIGTVIWAPLFLLYSPVLIYPTGIGGLIICVVVYAWPLWLAVLAGQTLPPSVYFKCFKCGQSEEYSIEKPKL